MNLLSEGIASNQNCAAERVCMVPGGTLPTLGLLCMLLSSKEAHMLLLPTAAPSSLHPPMQCVHCERATGQLAPLSHPLRQNCPHSHSYTGSKATRLPALETNTSHAGAQQTHRRQLVTALNAHLELTHNYEAESHTTPPCIACSGACPALEPPCMHEC